MKLVHDEGDMDRDEQAALWCMRLAEGTLAPDERAELTLWMEDPANAQAFHEQARLWGLIDEAAKTPEVVRMRGEALDEFRQANADRWARQEQADLEQSGRRGWRPWKLAAAAAIVALFAGTGLFLQDLPSSLTGDRPEAVVRSQVAEYRTGRAERSVTMLEDGSRLALDADSAVTVRITDDRREITVLAGRAGFTVAKNGRPFAVTAGDKTVVATGTRFSVELLGKATNVVLYEGSVIVLRGRLGSARQIATMQPGSALSLPAFGESSRTPPQVDAAHTPSWEDGQLEFVNEPLPAVVARLNRYATRPLVIGAGVPPDLKITGVFEANDTASFAQGVAALHGLKIEREADRTILAAGTGTPQ